MTIVLSTRSQQRLAGVHPDLVRVVHKAAEISTQDFMVLEGVRTLAKQREYFNAGKSKTMNSRHLPKPAKGVRGDVSHAIDLAPLIDLDGDGDLDVSWNHRDFKPIAAAMKQASAALGVPLTWGGDWRTFVDAPHFELPRAAYP